MESEWGESGENEKGVIGKSEWRVSLSVGEWRVSQE